MNFHMYNFLMPQLQRREGVYFWEKKNHTHTQKTDFLKRYVCINTFPANTICFYVPAIQRMVKGHIVLPLSVHPSPSGFSNLHFKFFRQGHPCPVDTVLVSNMFLVEKNGYWNVVQLKCKN